MIPDENPATDLINSREAGGGLGFDAFFSEAENSYGKCCTVVDEIVAGLAIDDKDGRYIRKAVRVCSFFYLIGAWLSDDRTRRTVAHAFCLHVLGLKLLDDIVDADTPCKNASLAVVGSLLCDEGHAGLAELGLADRYFQFKSEAFVSMWRDQFDLDIIPAASLDDWLVHSAKRNCRLLVFYAAFVATLPTCTLDGASTEKVFNAIGDIWSIYDDLRDLERDRAIGDNRHFNIGLLVATRSTTATEVAVLLKRRYDTVSAMIARHPPTLDFLPFLDHIVQRCNGLLVTIPSC